VWPTPPAPRTRRPRPDRGDGPRSRVRRSLPPPRPPRPRASRRSGRPSGRGEDRSSCRRLAILEERVVGAQRDRALRVRRRHERARLVVALAERALVRLVVSVLEPAHKAPPDLVLERYSA